jgi:hypothetical protein
MSTLWLVAFPFYYNELPLARGKNIGIDLVSSGGLVVSQSQPAMFDRYPRGFTGHVARPSRSIHAFLFHHVIHLQRESSFKRCGLNIVKQSLLLEEIFKAAAGD